jgi:molecular chaperone GrpE
MADPMPGSEGPAEPGPVIRDRRRLDPQTGQVRDPYGAARSGVAPKSRGRHNAGGKGSGPKSQAGGASGRGAGAKDPAEAAVAAAEAAAAEVEAAAEAEAAASVAARTAEAAAEAAETAGPADAETAAEADAKAGAAAAASAEAGPASGGEAPDGKGPDGKGPDGKGPDGKAPDGGAPDGPAGVDGSPADGKAGTAADPAELAAAREQAEERLADLQRLQAEFVNYRKRVERDRGQFLEVGKQKVFESLLPVLDDVHLARQHGDLESGPFAAIAEKLEAALQRLGLERYGEPGEAFDPEVHEALMHTQAELAEGTTVTTVVQVLQPGYRAGDRVLRPARVAVADPPA